MSKQSDQIVAEMVASQSLQLGRAIARIEQLMEENADLKKQLAQQTETPRAKAQRGRTRMALAESAPVSNAG